MRSLNARTAFSLAAALGAAAALVILGFAAQGPPAQAPPPPSPPAAEGQAPAQEPGAAATPAPELPRIIRVVCTDRLCGNCDGKCRKESGHVAVDKKGHCACTPTEGSPLDRAVRQAYEKRPPQ